MWCTCWFNSGMVAGTGMIILTIIFMALATYSTRIGGYLILSRYPVSRRVARMMEVAPGCILISVLAPDFASGRVADLLALGVTMLAALRFSLFYTVLIGIGSAWLLRAWVPV